MVKRLKSEWQVTDAGQRAKFYRLTPADKRHLVGEYERRTQLSAAITGIMNPAIKES